MLVLVGGVAVGQDIDESAGMLAPVVGVADWRFFSLCLSFVFGALAFCFLAMTITSPIVKSLGLTFFHHNLITVNVLLVVWRQVFEHAAWCSHLFFPKQNKSKPPQFPA